jgi:uncharacterized protein YndB with AHSA1/START domain
VTVAIKTSITCALVFVGCFGPQLGAAEGAGMKLTDAPIIVQATYHASANEVWKAITVADEMQKWYFNTIPKFEAKVGFEVVFDVANGERKFPHHWKVTKVVPLKRLEYDWKYDGYAGDALVSFVLAEHGDTTSLRVTYKAREDFADGIPEFQRESGLAGWRYFLHESLKAYLEKR